MQIEIKIDESAAEPKVIVIANKMSEEVDEIVRRISERKTEMLAGFADDTVTILETKDIFRIYSADSKVFARTIDKEYVLRLRLYELEDKLTAAGFVRVSNSEIINLKKVKNFDLSFTGTICVTMIDGSVTYVSRRYVSKIKKVLGM